MLGYVIRRLSFSVILILAIGTVTTLAVHLAPGDPAFLILGAELSPDPEMLSMVRHKLGLDRSVGQQILDGIYGLVRFDLGESLRDGRPILTLVGETLPLSLVLACTGMLLGIPFGMLLGVIAAVRHNTPVDWAATVIATAGISMPEFVTGVFLILFFCMRWRLISATSFVSFSEDPVAFLARLSLPATTLAFAVGSEVARMSRSCLLETLRADFVTTARGKGLRESVVLIKHAFRNSLIPVVAMLGVRAGTVLGRTVLIEAVFNWPGMMSTTIMAARFRDFPVVRGFVVTIAVIFILVNLGTDLVYRMVDPRIEYN